jgi:hypothetical protein
VGLGISDADAGATLVPADPGPPSGIVSATSTSATRVAMVSSGIAYARQP